MPDDKTIGEKIVDLRKKRDEVLAQLMGLPEKIQEIQEELDSLETEEVSDRVYVNLQVVISV